MPFDSLTMVPRDLKEAIDWLLATKVNEDSRTWWSMGLGLTRMYERQPAAVKMLPALEVIKQITKDFLERKEIRNQKFVRSVLDRINKPSSNTTGNDPQSLKVHVGSARGVGPRTLARSACKALYVCDMFLDDIKDHEKYRSAYASDVTWEESCDEYPEACAVVLVGIAPILYVGLRSLKEAAKAAVEAGPGSKEEIHLAKVMKAVGYTVPQCRSDLTSLDIRKALRGLDVPMLAVIYDFSGFWGLY
ncbi:hypothetical protein BBBOND_0208570 [Babesia bigemina]|uniref:Uncharacterized protein n=1 Tax=Babesia bigemina TaxID=5866 RepID=A0A061D558_BABBI|nr:hypothetical protein BBBOND_0208570 [Babesia bigemina]CDR95703.1 hypothetical protein BBBOND_0208570 [Babesia bigemina]|eukprot:XP_012767889.1 hypothetical protein BBBOND_0208570 [Babesia bigemina]